MSMAIVCKWSRMEVMDILYPFADFVSVQWSKVEKKFSNNRRSAAIKFFVVFAEEGEWDGKGDGNSCNVLCIVRELA